MAADTPRENWSRPVEDVQLQQHQVDIWRVLLDPSAGSVTYFESTLSADESGRAARFHFEADRKRFILAHGCLRGILARYLRCEPRQVGFSVGEFGKPVLAPQRELEFNLSHSGDVALIAVARRHSVGIDVERIRPKMEVENIAGRFFSPAEFSDLMALPPDQREAGFFNAWTRKEAYIKAHGLGLSLPLDSFDVSLGPGEPTALRATRPDAMEADHWTLVSIEVASGYAGALAIRGQGLEFKYWDWNANIG
jgi:4'-phosphopantetheinyl transferase